MSYVKFSTGLRNGLANATGFTTAFTNSVIYIYSGAPPASPDAAVTGTLLAKISVGSGAFAFGTSTYGLNWDAPSAGVVSKAAAETWSGVGIAAGTAGWARLMGNATDNLAVSTTLKRVDFDIANAGASGLLANLVVAVDAPIVVGSFAVTMPGGV